MKYQQNDILEHFPECGSLVYDLWEERRQYLDFNVPSVCWLFLMTVGCTVKVENGVVCVISPATCGLCYYRAVQYGKDFKPQSDIKKIDYQIVEVTKAFVNDVISHAEAN